MVQSSDRDFMMLRGHRSDGRFMITFCQYASQPSLALGIIFKAAIIFNRVLYLSSLKIFWDSSTLIDYCSEHGTTSSLLNLAADVVLVKSVMFI